MTSYSQPKSGFESNISSDSKGLVSKGIKILLFRVISISLRPHLNSGNWVDEAFSIFDFGFCLPLLNKALQTLTKGK